jgi:hypothetical protein
MSNFHGGIELIPLEETLGGSERWMGEVIGFSGSEMRVY